MNSLKENVKRIHEEIRKGLATNNNAKAKHGVKSYLDIHLRKRNVPNFPESSIKEFVHKEVLRENYQKLVNRIDFSKGHLLDHLLEREAISESDNENIMRHSQRKDKIRYLIHRFRHYCPDKFEIFLSSLRTEYPDLQNDLNKAYQEKSKIADQNICLFCRIIKTVDMADILDPLFEENLINDSIVEQKLNCMSLPHNSLWRQLFQQLKGVSSTCTDVLVKALTPKYKDIANELKCGNPQRVFACSCNSLVLSPSLQTDGSGSLSDISSQSSTSEKQVKYEATVVENVPKAIQLGVSKKEPPPTWVGIGKKTGPLNSGKGDRSQSLKRPVEVNDDQSHSTLDGSKKQEQDEKSPIDGKNNTQLTQPLQGKSKPLETRRSGGKSRQRRYPNPDQSVDSVEDNRPVSEKKPPEPRPRSHEVNSYTRLPSINDRDRSGKSERRTERSTSQD